MYPLCIFDVWYVEVFFLTPLIGLRIGKEGLITPPLQAAHKQKHTPPMQKTYTLHYAIKYW
jgi:hypothetical protein